MIWFDLSKFCPLQLWIFDFVHLSLESDHSKSKAEWNTGSDYRLRDDYITTHYFVSQFSHAHCNEAIVFLGLVCTVVWMGSFFFGAYVYSHTLTLLLSCFFFISRYSIAVHLITEHNPTANIRTNRIVMCKIGDMSVAQRYFSHYRRILLLFLFFFLILHHLYFIFFQV